MFISCYVKLISVTTKIPFHNFYTNQHSNNITKELS